MATRRMTKGCTQWRSRGLVHKWIGPHYSLLDFTVIQHVTMRLQQNFAHATTAQLSWHVQNFVAITWLSCLKYNEMLFPSDLYCELEVISRTGSRSTFLPYEVLTADTKDPVKRPFEKFVDMIFTLLTGHGTCSFRSSNKYRQKIWPCGEPSLLHVMHWHWLFTHI